MRRRCRVVHGCRGRPRARRDSPMQSRQTEPEQTAHFTRSHAPFLDRERITLEPTNSAIRAGPPRQRTQPFGYDARSPRTRGSRAFTPMLMQRALRFACIALAVVAVPSMAQSIRLGELNSYKTFPAFL